MAQDTYIFLPEIHPFPEGRGPKGELTRQEFETLTRAGIVLFTDNTNRTSGKTPIPHHFPYYQRFGNGTDELRYPNVTLAVARGLPGTYPVTTQHWYDPQKGLVREKGRWTDDDIDECRKVLREDFEIIRTAIIDATIDPSRTEPLKVYMPGGGEGFFNSEISAISQERTPKIYAYLKAQVETLHALPRVLQDVYNLGVPVEDIRAMLPEVSHGRLTAEAAAAMTSDEVLREACVWIPKNTVADREKFLDALEAKVIESVNPHVEAPGLMQMGNIKLSDIRLAPNTKVDLSALALEYITPVNDGSVQAVIQYAFSGADGAVTLVGKDINDNSVEVRSELANPDLVIFDEAALSAALLSKGVKQEQAEPQPAHQVPQNPTPSQKAADQQPVAATYVRNPLKLLTEKNYEEATKIISSGVKPVDKLTIVPAKEIPDYVKAHGAVDTLRHPYSWPPLPDGTRVHFGNPVSHEAERMEGASIKARSVEEASAGYLEWLIGAKYLNVEPMRRRWIINGIFGGHLFGKEFVYYTDHIPSPKDGADWERGYNGEESYSMDYAPNHAHILLYFVNHPDRLASMINTVGQIRNTPAEPEKVVGWFNRLTPSEKDAVLRSTGNLRQDTITREAAAIVKERLEERVVSMLDEEGKETFYQEVFNALPDATKVDMYNQALINGYCTTECRYWVENQRRREEKKATRPQETTGEQKNVFREPTPPKTISDTERDIRISRSTLERFTVITSGAKGAEKQFADAVTQNGAVVIDNIAAVDVNGVMTPAIPQADRDEAVRIATQAAQRLYGYKTVDHTGAPRPFTNENIIRHYCLLKEADALYAVGQIGRAGEPFYPGMENCRVHCTVDTVTGTTGYAVDMAVLMGKPVYVFNQGGSMETGWFAYNPETLSFDRLDDTPALSRHAAFIGDHYVTDKGKDEIKELVQGTIASITKQQAPSATQKEDREINITDTRQLIIALWFKDLSFSEKKAAISSIQWPSGTEGSFCEGLYTIHSDILEKKYDKADSEAELNKAFEALPDNEKTFAYENVNNKYNAFRVAAHNIRDFVRDNLLQIDDDIKVREVTVASGPALAERESNGALLLETVQSQFIPLGGIPGSTKEEQARAYQAWLLSSSPAARAIQDRILRGEFIGIDVAVPSTEITDGSYKGRKRFTYPTAPMPEQIFKHFAENPEELASLINEDESLWLSRTADVTAAIGAAMEADVLDEDDKAILKPETTASELFGRLSQDARRSLFARESFTEALAGALATGRGGLSEKDGDIVLNAASSGQYVSFSDLEALSDNGWKLLIDGSQALADAIAIPEVRFLAISEKGRDAVMSNAPAVDAIEVGQIASARRDMSPNHRDNVVVKPNYMIASARAYGLISFAGYGRNLDSPFRDKVGYESWSQDQLIEETMKWLCMEDHRKFEEDRRTELLSSILNFRFVGREIAASPTMAPYAQWFLNLVNDPTELADRLSISILSKERPENMQSVISDFLPVRSINMKDIDQRQEAVRWFSSLSPADRSMVLRQFAFDSKNRASQDGRRDYELLSTVLSRWTDRLDYEKVSEFRDYLAGVPAEQRDAFTARYRAVQKKRGTKAPKGDIVVDATVLDAGRLIPLIDSVVFKIEEDKTKKKEFDANDKALITKMAESFKKNISNWTELEKKDKNAAVQTLFGKMKDNVREEICSRFAVRKAAAETVAEEVVPPLREKAVLSMLDAAFSGKPNDEWISAPNDIRDIVSSFASSRERSWDLLSSRERIEALRKLGTDFSPEAISCITGVKMKVLPSEVVFVNGDIDEQTQEIHRRAIHSHFPAALVQEFEGRSDREKVQLFEEWFHGKRPEIAPDLLKSLHIELIYGRGYDDIVVPDYDQKETLTPEGRLHQLLLHPEKVVDIVSKNPVLYSTYKKDLGRILNDIVRDESNIITDAQRKKLRQALEGGEHSERVLFNEILSNTSRRAIIKAYPLISPERLEAGQRVNRVPEGDLYMALFESLSPETEKAMMSAFRGTAKSEDQEHRRTLEIQAFNELSIGQKRAVMDALMDGFGSRRTVGMSFLGDKAPRSYAYGIIGDPPVKRSVDFSDGIINEYIEEKYLRMHQEFEFWKGEDGTGVYRNTVTGDVYTSQSELMRAIKKADREQAELEEDNATSVEAMAGDAPEYETDDETMLAEDRIATEEAKGYNSEESIEDAQQADLSEEDGEEAERLLNEDDRRKLTARGVNWSALDELKKRAESDHIKERDKYNNLESRIYSELMTKLPVEVLEKARRVGLDWDARWEAKTQKERLDLLNYFAYNENARDGRVESIRDADLIRKALESKDFKAASPEEQAKVVNELFKALSNNSTGLLLDQSEQRSMLEAHFKDLSVRQKYIILERSYSSLSTEDKKIVSPIVDKSSDDLKFKTEIELAAVFNNAFNRLSMPGKKKVMNHEYSLSVVTADLSSLYQPVVAVPMGRSDSVTAFQFLKNIPPALEGEDGRPTRTLVMDCRSQNQKSRSSMPGDELKDQCSKTGMDYWDASYAFSKAEGKDYDMSFQRIVEAVGAGKRVVLVTGSERATWNDTTFTVMQELARRNIECAHVTGNHHVETQDAVILKFIKDKENYILASGSTKDIHFTVNWEKVEGLNKKVIRFEAGPNVVLVKDKKDEIHKLYSEKNANFAEGNSDYMPEFVEHPGMTRNQMITATGATCSVGISFHTNTMKNQNVKLAQELCPNISWFDVCLPSRKDLLNGEEADAYDSTEEGQERSENGELVNLSIEKKVEKIISNHKFSVNLFQAVPGEPFRIFVVGPTGHEMTYQISQAKMTKEEANPQAYSMNGYCMNPIEQVSLEDYQAYADRFIEVLLNKLNGREQEATQRFWDDDSSLEAGRASKVKIATFEENFDCFQTMINNACVKYSAKYGEVSARPEINGTDAHEVTFFDARKQKAKLVKSKILTWNPYFLNMRLDVDVALQRKQFVTREYDLHRALLLQGGDAVAECRVKMMDVLFQMGFAPKDAFEFAFRNINDDSPVTEATIIDVIKKMNLHVGKGNGFICPADFSERAIFEISMKFSNLNDEVVSGLLFDELTARGVSLETLGRIHASIALVNESEYGTVKDFDKKVEAIVDYEKNVKGGLLSSKEDLEQFSESPSAKELASNMSVDDMQIAMDQTASAMLTIARAYPRLDGERLTAVLEKAVDYLCNTRAGVDRRLRNDAEVHDFFVKMNAGRAVQMPETFGLAAVKDAMTQIEEYEAPDLVVPNRPAPECIAVMIRLFGHSGASQLMQNYPKFLQGKDGVVLDSPAALSAFLASEEAGVVTAAYAKNKLSIEDLTNAFIAEGRRFYDNAFKRGIGVVYPGDGKYPTLLTEGYSRTFSVDKSYQAHRRIRKGGGEVAEPVLVTEAEMMDAASIRLAHADESVAGVEAALAALIREAKATAYEHIIVADINTREGREAIKRADEDKPMVVIQYVQYKGEDAEEIYRHIEERGGLIVNPSKLGEDAGKALWIIGKQHGRANTDNKIIASFLEKQQEKIGARDAVDNVRLVSAIDENAGRRTTVVQQKEYAPAMLAYKGNIDLLNSNKSMGTVALLSELRISANANNNPAGMAAARAVTEAVADQHEHVTIAASLNSASGQEAIKTALQRHVPVVAVTANPLSGTADASLISRIVAAGGLVLSEADVLGISDKDILLGRSLDLLASVSSSAVVLESLRPGDSHLAASRRKYMDPAEVLAGYHGHVAVVSYGEKRGADLCKAFLSVGDGQKVDYDGLIKALRHNNLFTPVMEEALREDSVLNSAKRAGEDLALAEKREDGFRRVARREAANHSYDDAERYAGAAALLKRQNVTIISTSGEGMDDVFAKMKNTAPEEYIGQRYLMDRVDDLTDSMNLQLDPPHLRLQVFRKDDIEVFVVPPRYEVVREAVRRLYGNDAIFVSYPEEAKGYIKRKTVPGQTKDSSSARVLPQAPSESMLVYTRLSGGQVFGYENAPGFLKDAETDDMKAFRDISDTVRQYMKTLYTAAGYMGTGTIACRNACWAKVEDRLITISQGDTPLATIALDSQNRLIIKNINNLFLGSMDNIEDISMPILVGRKRAKKDDNLSAIVEDTKQRIFRVLLSSETHDDQYYHTATNLEETEEYLLATREEREEMRKQLEESNESVLLMKLRNVESFRNDVAEAIAAGVIQREGTEDVEEDNALRNRAYAALSTSRQSAVDELEKAQKAVTSAEGSLDILRSSVDEFSAYASDTMASEDGLDEINKSKIEAAQATVASCKDAIKAISSRIDTIDAAIRSVAVSRSVRDGGTVEEIENTSLRLRDYTSIYRQVQNQLRGLLAKVNDDLESLNASYENGLAYILSDKFNVKSNKVSAIDDIIVGDKKTQSTKREWLDGQIEALSGIKEDVEALLATISQNPITSIKNEKAITALRSVMESSSRVMERSKMTYENIGMKMSSLINADKSVDVVFERLRKLGQGLKQATMENLVSLKKEFAKPMAAFETASKMWPHKGVSSSMNAVAKAYDALQDDIQSVIGSKEYAGVATYLASVSEKAGNLLDGVTLSAIISGDVKESVLTHPDLSSLGEESVQALSDKLDALVKLAGSNGKRLEGDVNALRDALMKASQTARAFNRHFDIAAGVKGITDKAVEYMKEKMPVLDEGKRKTVTRQVVVVDGGIQITLPVGKVSDADLEQAENSIKELVSDIDKKKKEITERIASIESPYDVLKTSSSEGRCEVVGKYTVLLDTCTDKGNNVYIAITNDKDGNRGRTYVRKTADTYVPVCGDMVFASAHKFKLLGGMVTFRDGKCNIVCHNGTLASPINFDEITKDKDKIFCQDQSRPFITVKLDGLYNLLDFETGALVGEWTGTPRTATYNEKTKKFEIYSAKNEKVLELDELPPKKAEKKAYTPKP